MSITVHVGIAAFLIGPVVNRDRRAAHRARLRRGRAADFAWVSTGPSKQSGLTKVTVFYAKNAFQTQSVLRLYRQPLQLHEAVLK